MSEVFVLTGGYDYEGETVLGVYDTQEHAAEEGHRIHIVDGYFDYTEIHPFIINTGGDYP